MEYLTLVFGFSCGFFCAFFVFLAYFLLPDDISTLLFYKWPQKSLIVKKMRVASVVEGLPADLKQILTGPGRGDLLTSKEPCIAISLMLQFLFQEFKNSKNLKRWILKKLQMDFNELMSRNAIGSKIIKDIKVDRLDIGRRPPIIKGISVSNFTLSKNEDSFETLDLLLDIEYNGDFSLSLDVVAFLGQECSISVNLNKLLGQVRFQFTRLPFTHWSACFISDPVIDFKIDPKFRGRPMPHLVAIIMGQVRRTIRKRHVFPAYKLRFRPLLQNPLLVPSSDPDTYAYIEVKGCLKLTILNCTRLNLFAVPAGHDQIFCAVSTAEKPYTARNTSVDYVTLAIKFIRHTGNPEIGLQLSSRITEADSYSRQVVVIFMKENSAADKAGFKLGDKILAVNNIAITTDRQAAKLLNNTSGEIVAIVERALTKLPEKESCADFFPVTIVPNQDDTILIGRQSDCGHRQLTDFSGCPTEKNWPMGNKVKLTAKTRSLGDLRDNLDGCDASFEMVPSIDKDSAGKLQKTFSTLSIFQRSGLENGNFEKIPLETLHATETKSELLVPGSLKEKQTLTRKQRIAERALFVAQKLSSSKTSVRQMITKRMKLTPSSSSLAPHTAHVLRRSSESDEERLTREFDVSESEINKEGGDIAEKIPMRSLEARRRSKSEDYSVELTGKNENWKTPKFDLVLPPLDTEKEQPDDAVSVKDATFEKKSKCVKLERDIHFDQRFKIPLDPRLKYVVLRIYSQPNVQQTDGNPLCHLLGYVNLLLPEVLDDCSSTASLCTVQSYVLRPSGVVKIPPIYQHLSTHAGFDSRLCYGDIILKFQWFPSGTPNMADSEDECETATINPVHEQMNENPATDTHTWEGANFARGTTCDACQRKIWLKWALKCSKCGMICHKKCVNKSNMSNALRKCEEIFENVAHEKLDSDNVAACEAMEASESMDLPPIHATPCSSNSDQTNQRSYGRKFLSDKIANLGRRKKLAQPKANAENTTILVNSPANEKPSVEVANFWPAEYANFSPSVNSPMLYTKCGTYNEHMIYSAKQLGKDLFLDLAPVERKNKINEQIDGLQRDIDKTVEKRLDLLTKLKTSDLGRQAKVELQVGIKKMDDQLQTLAILMLHYCAGLQNCYDLEESDSCESSSVQTGANAQVNRSTADVFSPSEISEN